MSSYVSLSGKILVIISIIIQINFYIYFYNRINSKPIKILYLCNFPFFFVITSFFCFYLVNLLYNIITPSGWIQTNSKYLAYNEPTIQNYFVKSNDINLEINYYNSSLKNSLDSYEQNNSIYYKPIVKKSQTNINNQFDMNNNEIIITIQIPVYTENFDFTLKKTFDNIIDLCNLYNNDTNNKLKLNLFINDDGLQVIDTVEKEKRINYYSQYDFLFWIARPNENRTGKFKKASNMNFCIRNVLLANYTNPIGNITYTWEYLSDKFNFEYKKSNCYDFKFGKYILLFDSDSFVNPNCIDKLIYEIENNPKIGFLQMKTNANKVVNNFWQNIISHFTNSIYDNNFLYSCSNGFPSPLVGHNCLLNFEIMLMIEKNINGYYPREYINWKVWDENRVSEDFVMSLHMMDLGYYGKYIYFDCGMKEGVTINMIDEIIKLKKYMYGINEILFYPIKNWFKKGITTEILSVLLFSRQIDIFTKYALISYIGSYYAICISPLISFLYYFINIFPSDINNIFTDSNYAIVSFIILFYILSICSNIFINLKKKNTIDSIFKIIFNELYYGIMLMGFFSSIPYHLFITNIDYLFSRKMYWHSTNKSNISINYFYFIKEYKIMFIIGSIVFFLVNLLNLYFYFYHNSNYFIYSIPINLIIFFHLIFPIFLLK